jgi:hypothetical protein
MSTMNLMTIRPVICPECGARQEPNRIKGTWFPCGNCEAHLQPAQSWQEKLWWTGAVLAIVILVTLKVIWWISILLWFPMSIVIAVVVAILSPDTPIESDKPHSRPGSTLGL